jgi:hypothetical protein
MHRDKMDESYTLCGLVGKRNPIMLKMVPMGDKMLLHWASPGSFDEPRMLELNVDDYVDDTAKADGMHLKNPIETL